MRMMRSDRCAEEDEDAGDEGSCGSHRGDEGKKRGLGKSRLALTLKVQTYPGQTGRQ
jgi:hypothetical protein